MSRFRVGQKVYPNERGIARLKQAAAEYPTHMGPEINAAFQNTPWTVESVREDDLESHALTVYMFKESVYLGCFEGELEPYFETYLEMV